MTESSRIRSDIDYDKRGKQVSHLAVPSSTNESAYGTVTVPIAVFNHGTGPTFFITGGVQGDEYEGPVCLMNLIRELEAEQIEGRLIVIPCLNLPAVMSGNRCSPVDGLNMNRVFPGSRDSTITEMIAHYVCQVLLPMVDVQLDLHSGGNTLKYIPSMMMWSCPDPATIRITATGLRNLLKHFGMVEGDVETPESQGRPPSRLAEVADLENYVMAPDSGIYESFVDLWDVIDEGRPIGQVHYPDDLGKPPCITHAPRSGFLLFKRPPGQVKRGDNIAIIGQDLDLNKHGLR